MWKLRSLSSGLEIHRARDSQGCSRGLTAAKTASPSSVNANTCVQNRCCWRHRVKELAGCHRQGRRGAGKGSRVKGGRRGHARLVRGGRGGLWGCWCRCPGTHAAAILRANPPSALPPQRYVDGGFTGLQPVSSLEEAVITVSPFTGELDICPRDCPAIFFCFQIFNGSIQISIENLCRISYALFPPSTMVSPPGPLPGFGALKAGECWTCLPKLYGSAQSLLLINQISRRGDGTCCFCRVVFFGGRC